MKKQRRKLWRRLSWALATAGSLALFADVNAQTSPYRPLGAETSVRNMMKRPLHPRREALANREIEANVELAWLASPLTFPYWLEVHVVGSALVAKGHLPSKALYTEALKIAREESGMPVADSIKIYPDLTVTPTSKPAHVLCREVNDALAHALPAALDNISVSVWMHGQVTLKGIVATYEDKLTASRCLRRVAGCSCVINQLQVCHPAAMKSPAIPSCEHQQVAVKDTQVKEAPVQTSSVQVMPPQSIKLDINEMIPILTLPETPKTPEQPLVQNPAGTLASTVSYGILYEARQDKDEKSPFAYHPTRWRKPDDSTVLANKPIKLHPKAEAAGNSEAIVQASQPAPPAMMPALRLPPATEPVGSQAQNAATQDAMQASDGIVFFDETETQAETKAKPGTSETQAETKAKPGTSETQAETKAKPGTTETQAETKTKPGTPGLQKQLQQLIAAACQKPVQEVEVVVVSETKLEVRVKARCSQECEELSTRIFQIPELTPYQVSLEIPLDK